MPMIRVVRDRSIEIQSRAGLRAEVRQPRRERVESLANAWTHAVLSRGECSRVRRRDWRARRVSLRINATARANLTTRRQKSAAFYESYEIQSQTRNAGSGLFSRWRRVLLVFFSAVRQPFDGRSRAELALFPSRSPSRPRVHTTPRRTRWYVSRPGSSALPTPRRAFASGLASRLPARHWHFADAVALASSPMISQPAVPETALKRRKRDEAWAAKKATADAEAAAASKKNSEEIFKRAEKYVKEYRDQVRFGETRPRVPHTNTSLFPTPARRRPAAARRERAKTRSDRRGGFGE